MIPKKRKEVIENIRYCAENGEFHTKTEVDDPVFDNEMRQKVLHKYLLTRKTFLFKIKNRTAECLLNMITRKWNKNAVICGLEHVTDIDGGAVITCNHFAPEDNTIIRNLVHKLHKGGLCIVSQDTNLAMSGIVGFFMKNTDVIPISREKTYMQRHFDRLIAESLKKKKYVLIYPEQEMWFRYRKPRPPKRGAYYYAAKYDVPVISCFVEIKSCMEMETAEFHKVTYVLHVLEPIFPDRHKTVRENSIEMCRQDYAQKKEAYETAYGRKLIYEFSAWDIAGWEPANNTEE